MKKMTLDLDALKVDSYETTQREDEKGTVAGYWWESWSENSVCPTTEDTRCRPCSN